jgi:hypothetical protein
MGNIGWCIAWGKVENWIRFVFTVGGAGND